jgi:glutamate dehydrogenase
MSWEKGKQKLQNELAQLIASKAEPEQALQVDALARLFYRSFPAEDMRGCRVDDLYGFIYGAWRSLRNWDGSSCRVRIFQPDLEKHGWESHHSVVVVIARDMPFILDSVRGELNRRNATIHKLHGQNFALKRNDRAELVGVEPLSPEAREAAGIVYMEINPISDAAVVEDIVSSLDDILSEVSLVVSDFPRMRDKLAEVVAMVEGSSLVSPEQRQENVDFLAWLMDDHATLLGYECLGVQHGVDRVQVVAVEDSRMGLLRKRSSRGLTDLTEDLQALGGDTGALLDCQLTFSKSRERSRVHRFAYPDYVQVSEFDERGQLVLQHRFLCLYTFSVYNESARQIPVVRRKVEQVMALSGLDSNNHDGRELARILEQFPRDELFQADVDSLFRMSGAINQIQERRQVRLFARPDPHGKFFNCLVYMPRDLYNTEKRVQIQATLCDSLGAVQSEFTTYFSESILVRIHFVLLMEPGRGIEYDLEELEQEILAITQSWGERLREGLIDEFGEEQGSRLSEKISHGFPAGYRDDFDTRIAVMDVSRLLRLIGGSELEMSLHQMVDEREELLHFRLYRRHKPLPLSDVLPILEHLGLRVEAETPYCVRVRGDDSYWIQDFSLVYSLGDVIDLESVRDEFTDAFARIWFGEAESDAFNRLLLGSRMNWRELAMLRAYARYLKQINFSFSTDYIAETLGEHLHITGAIVELFLTRFDPDFEGDSEWRASREEEIVARVIESLESVENLGQDRIIRQYLALIQATLRTNFFQRDGEGALHGYFSFKMEPALIPDMPAPRPAFEIFVYSPRVEGVHLRGGKVARGGLRWSDRLEDFRTEVLGLVKAQQVKNAVIVPVGAKGGFVVKQSTAGASPEEAREEGISCYRIFIQGLLDITDNLVDGSVVPPQGVVRKDDDDTYLVVAADKGTATFSDIANEISRGYGFWLGDAFASGGSAGYDHKKMGITARGAWVSVQQHFRELGLDVQNNDFTVIGIGDMAGDVFGNGMLLSDHIQLVAAFNHQHIFVDPAPDAAQSFAERKRLFALSGSSWSDYDVALISPGGGVFRRSAKSIDISPEMQESFDIADMRLTPNELIHALLKARVDLLWNGGIGTYVKGSQQTNADVGDKANDAVRVNGSELRCKVVGEGGNLGLTQLGRVEYALAGGRCNTDFIDNAGGVDCSDHEVNIKILLNAVVDRGDLTVKQRNRLLEEMTESVAEMVLENNYHQVGAISLAESEAVRRAGEYQRIISQLEQNRSLDRELEFLPSHEELNERRVQGLGLTRPELALLISYSKGLLKEELCASSIPNDTYMAGAIEGAFPRRLLEEYGEEVHAHGLRREIIATQVANDLINRAGVSFVGRLVVSTGASIADIVTAYVVARDILAMESHWRALEALDFVIDSSLQLEINAELVLFLRRASRWLLRNRRQEFDPAQALADFQPGILELQSALPGLLVGQAAQQVRERYQSLVAQGVDGELAQFTASSSRLYAGFGIIEAARDTDASIMEVAELYFRLGEALGLDWFADAIGRLKVESAWQALARDAYLEDLEWQQRSLATGALRHLCEKRDIQLCITRWIEQESVLIERWQEMLSHLHSVPEPDFAMFAVANRELLDLAQSSLR